MRAMAMLGVLAVLAIVARAQEPVTLLGEGTHWHTYVQFLGSDAEKAVRLKVPRGFSDPFVQWGYGVDTPWPVRVGFQGMDDVRGWLRRPAGFLGGYGYRQPTPARVFMHARFDVENPERAGDLRLTLTYRGGVMVCLNGHYTAWHDCATNQVGAPAVPYPREAFVTPAGDALLPATGLDGVPPAGLKERYDLRLRTHEMTIPWQKLKAGRNDIGLIISAAPIPDDLPKAGGPLWNPCGLVRATLTAAPGTAAVSNNGAPDGVRLWVADILQVPGRDVLYPGALDGAPKLDLSCPRGGVASGQLVLSGPGPLPAFTVTASALTDGRRRMPAPTIRIRYPDTTQAWMPLRETPMPGVSLQPIWVTVDVPADAESGHYVSTITAAGEGFTCRAELTVRVVGWTMPTGYDRRTHVNLLQSPESIARYYNVPLWSDEHFRLLEHSFALMGQAGNSVLGVAVIGKSVWGDDPLVVYRRVDGKPVPDMTYLERYLTLYNRHAGEPKLLAVHVWNCHHQGRGGVGDAGTPPFHERRDGALVPFTDQSEEMWAATFDGIRATLAKVGWTRVRLLLGTGGDQYPHPDIVKLFQRVAPEAQWRAITHGQGSPKWGETDRERTQPNGMVVGYLEMARRTGTLRQRFPHAPVSSNARDHVGANPYHMRELALLHTGRCNYDGFAWKGLDYFSFMRAGKRWNVLNTYLPFGNVVGGTPRAIAAPGPDGAIATVQFELLRQGIQECETFLYVDRMLKDPAAVARMGQEDPEFMRGQLDRLLDLVETGDRITGGCGEYDTRIDLLYTFAEEITRRVGAGGA